MYSSKCPTYWIKRIEDSNISEQQVPIMEFYMLDYMFINYYSYLHDVCIPFSDRLTTSISLGTATARRGYSLANL